MIHRFGNANGRLGRRVAFAGWRAAMKDNVLVLSTFGEHRETGRGMQG